MRSPIQTHLNESHAACFPYHQGILQIQKPNHIYPFPPWSLIVFPTVGKLECATDSRVNPPLHLDLRERRLKRGSERSRWQQMPICSWCLWPPSSAIGIFSLLTSQKTRFYEFINFSPSIFWAPAYLPNRPEGPHNRYSTNVCGKFVGLLPF